MDKKDLLLIIEIGKSRRQTDLDKNTKCLAVYLVAGYHSRGVTGKEKPEEWSVEKEILCLSTLVGLVFQIKKDTEVTACYYMLDIVCKRVGN